MKTCAYCSNPAVFWCRAHRRYMCAGKDCAGQFGLHRTAVRPEFCEYVDPRRFQGMDWLIAIGAAVVAAAGVVIVWVHL